MPVSPSSRSSASHHGDRLGRLAFAASARTLVNGSTAKDRAINLKHALTPIAPLFAVVIGVVGTARDVTSDLTSLHLAAVKVALVAHGDLAILVGMDY